MSRDGADPRGRRGAARATRERETLRVNRYAQRLEREGRAPSPRPATPSQAPPAPWYEADVVPGLEGFATSEMRRLLGARLSVRPGTQAGTLSFQTRADPSV